MADETGQEQSAGPETEGEKQYAYSKAPKLRPGEAAVLKARFECANRYYEECFKEPAARSRELYTGSHWRRGTKKQRNNPVINYSKFSADTQTGALAHNPGDADLKPLNEEGEANLDVSRRALKWGERASHAHREAKRGLRDCFTYGMGLAHICWRYEEPTTPAVEGRAAATPMLDAVQMGEGLPPMAEPPPPVHDEPFVKRIDPRLFRVSPEADWVIEDADWCGYVQFRPLDEVKADPRYRKGIARQLKGTAKSLKSYLSSEERTKKDEELRSDVKRVEEWHYFEKRRRLHIVFAAEHAEPLMVKEWYWQFEGYPFSMLCTPRLEDEFYPAQTPMTETEHQQMAINEAATQLMAHRRRGNRIYLANEEALSNNAKKKLEAGEDGTLVGVKSGQDPSKAVYQFPHQPLQAEVYQDRDQALTDMRAIKGISGYESGVVPSKRLNADEVAAIQGAGGALQKEMQQRYEAFYADILGKIFALMQQYAIRTRMLPIYDPNRPDAVMGWGPWDKDKIQGQYLFEIVVGSTMQGKQQQKTQANGFFLQSLQPYAQMGVFNPAPLIEGMLRADPDIRNVEAIMTPPPPPMLPGQPPPGGEEMGGAPAAPPEGAMGGGAVPPGIEQLLMQMGGQ